MTDSRYLFDSSAWLGFLQGENGELKGLIRSTENTILTSALSFFEIPRKLIKRGVSQASIKRSMEFIRKNSIIIEIDSSLCELAVKDAISKKLHAMDAIIYRSGIENDALLMTMDYDFHKLAGVRIVKRG